VPVSTPTSKVVEGEALAGRPVDAAFGFLPPVHLQGAGAPLAGGSSRECRRAPAKALQDQTRTHSRPISPYEPTSAIGAKDNVPFEARRGVPESS